MKIFKKILTLILTITLLSCFTGCGKKKDVNPDEKVTYEPVKKEIGPSGGVIKDANVKLDIPKGALSNNTEISSQYVSYTGEISDDISNQFIGGAIFGPSGTTFEKPVSVSLKLTKKPINKTLSVFCYDEENDVWDFVTEAKVKDGKANFEVVHFSKYKALDTSPEMYAKFVELVHYAKANKMDDAWIKDTYTNYLVNEKHVLDYYAEFCGLYYEPCGVSVSGFYHIDGKEGNPNDLITLVGKTNMVGNKYGLTLDGSLHISTNEFNLKRGKIHEYQEIIHVDVGLYYNMIKPTIDVTPGSGKLKAGKSLSVNVHCHYPNPTNILFPDFDLPYYNLTFPYILNHLTLDRREMYTDLNGNAHFKITSLDGKAEQVKVMFYEEGIFGQYADAYVNILEDEEKTTKKNKTKKDNKKQTFNFTGHVVDEHVHYYSKIDPSHGEGLFTVKIEYDIEGTFTFEEYDLNYTGYTPPKETYGDGLGSFSIKNVTASVTSTPLHFSSEHETSTYKYYIDPITTVPYEFESIRYEFSRAFGFGSDDVTYAYYGEEEEYNALEIIEINGISSCDVNYYDNHYSGQCNVSIDAMLSSPLILDFEFKEGTYTSTKTSDSFLGATTLYPSYPSIDEWRNEAWPAIRKWETKTTQEITITKA